jgi:hypothetical protein
LISSKDKIDIPYIAAMHVDQVSLTAQRITAVVATVETDDPELVIVVRKLPLMGI